MYSTLYNVPMVGTLQTLILTSPTTKTPSLRHRSQHFPSNRALFHIPSITFNRDRSFRRPITALDRSDQVRPPPIPFLSITCFSYLFGYRENVGKNKIEFTISKHFWKSVKHIGFGSIFCMLPNFFLFWKLRLKFHKLVMWFCTVV